MVKEAITGPRLALISAATSVRLPSAIVIVRAELYGTACILSLFSQLPLPHILTYSLTMLTRFTRLAPAFSPARAAPRLRTAAPPRLARPLSSNAPRRAVYTRFGGPQGTPSGPGRGWRDPYSWSTRTQVAAGAGVLGGVWYVSQ
jgi:hypothetical protein